MRRILPMLFVAVPLFACGGVVTSDIELAPGSWAGEGTLPPVHHEVVIQPAEDAPTLQPVAHQGSVTSLALMQSRIVVGSGEGLWVATGEDSLELEPMDVRVNVREPSAVSGVEVVGERQNGDLLISTPEGVFHGFEGSFFRSPLSDLITPGTVRFINGAGLGDDEHVWVTTDESVEVHGKGSRWRLRIRGLPNASFAAGIVASQGYLSVGDDLWIVQAEPGRAAKRLTGIGPVTHARWSNGTLVMAARNGLLEAKANSALDVTTFLDANGGTLRVRAVDHGPGGVHVLVGDHVLRRSEGTFLHIAEIPGARDHMAVDAWGQIWVDTEGGLIRVRSGEQVGFSRIEPFLVQHCIRCHDAGFEGAPVIDFLDYEVSKEWADRILARVSDSQSPMPPRRVQILAPEDWALVKRWVEGGALP